MEVDARGRLGAVVALVLFPLVLFVPLLTPARADETGANQGPDSTTAPVVENHGSVAHADSVSATSNALTGGIAPEVSVTSGNEPSPTSADNSPAAVNAGGQPGPAATPAREGGERQPTTMVDSGRSSPSNSTAPVAAPPPSNVLPVTTAASTVGPRPVAEPDLIIVSSRTQPRLVLTLSLLFGGLALASVPTLVRRRQGRAPAL